MVRVSKTLLAANMLIGAALAGCGSSDGAGEDDGFMPRPNLIQFSPIYSAYDGEHEFQITPFVPSANPMSMDADPVMDSTLKWKVDGAFLKEEPFSEIPGARLFTTKKAGTTTITVTATTKSGLKIKGTSQLTISKAEPAEWAMGEARYNNGMTFSFFGGGMGGMPMAAAGGMGSCGLPINLEGRIPTNTACGNCHNNNTGLVVEHTPTQTAGYSNDQLIEIFTQAMKPAGGTFNSPFLRTFPMPDCIYKTFHTWQIDDETKNGIVWKLRSIKPKKQEDIDIARLTQMAARMGMGMAPGGAAGAAAP